MGGGGGGGGGICNFMIMHACMHATLRMSNF